MLGAIVATVIVAACAGLGYIVSVAATAPDISKLKPLDQGATSAVYAADGKQRLGFIQGDVLRTPIRSSRMPDTMRQATVAIEDRRFYKHRGVDFEGVVRAAIKNISSRETVEGGSTLTMQLVKNLYTEDRSRTGLEGYKRKVREAKLAVRSRGPPSRARGKAWILTQYLNNAPYGTVGGQQAVGIEAAARIFFDKPARRLKLAESALLAGLPQAPSRYNPFLDHERRARAAQRGPAADGRRGLHQRRRRPSARRRRRWASRRASTTPSAARATSSTTSGSS